MFLLLTLLASTHAFVSICNGTVVNADLLACDYVYGDAVLNLTLASANASRIAQRLQLVSRTLTVDVTYELNFTALFEAHNINVKIQQNMHFANLSKVANLNSISMFPTATIAAPLVDEIDNVRSKSLAGSVTFDFPQLVKIQNLSSVGPANFQMPKLQLALLNVELIGSGDVSFPKLASVSRHLIIANSTYAQQVYLPLLDNVGGTLAVDFNPKVRNVSFPTLRNVGFDFVIGDLDVYAPRLRAIGGHLCSSPVAQQDRIFFLPALRSISSHRQNRDTLPPQAKCFDDSKALHVVAGKVLDLSSLRRIKGDAYVVVQNDDIVVDFKSLQSVQQLLIAGKSAKSFGVGKNAQLDSLMIVVGNLTDSDVRTEFDIGENVTVLQDLDFDISHLDSLTGVATDVHISSGSGFTRKLVLPSLCCDEVHRFAEHFGLNVSAAVCNASCSSCGNGVLNFGELADCPPSSCLLASACASGVAVPGNCTCAALPATTATTTNHAKKSSTVSDSTSQHHQFTSTSPVVPITPGFRDADVYLIVASVALCVVCIVASFLISRTLRKSRGTVADFERL